MTKRRAAMSAVGLLATGALAVAPAVAGAEDVGATPLTRHGPKPASYCKVPLQGLCATVQPTTDGSGTFVVTVFAPSNTTVKRFDVWSGTAATKLRPKALCRAAGKSSSPEYQEGPYFRTRCSETIKPSRHQTYCLAGLSRIPSTQGAGTTYPVYVDGGSAGAGAATSIPATSRCPAGVATRRRHR
ncbi:hypothetical protein Q5424_25820 [Conexibacter sp. JD483]|uniref:hypothetical protein n=1 Tax=unclassified Conexibacter TaxID=2627773 RepID=UPI00271B111F|nr:MULTISPECIES: hypothetical protein [unclassified Conexibacter]MDO8189364.1 hypothetical protein [Conexibacter sp. CPCC 205706]MDO8197359.1 hypothetical protein [Conexibacter sp. CPCC 205762]MDR9372543.1 hypothetical protein [Conexibacter sp. JD483]